MKKIGLVMASAMLVCSFAQGAAITWSGAGTDLLIENPDNWVGGVVPIYGTDSGTITDTAVQNNDRLGDSSGLNYDVTFAGSTSLTNQNSNAPKMSGSYLTFNDTSSFDVNGERLFIGVTSDASMTWNSTGAAYGIQRLEIGSGSAAGTLTQTAGTITSASDLRVNAGVFTISGGTMNATGLAFGGTIDFLTTGTTGTVNVVGYTVAAFQTAIDAGQITLDGIAQTPSDYSGFSITDDSITVIPEPATLGMVAAFGGAILFIRRKLMI